MIALLRFLGAEADTLVDHAAGYADLAGQEFAALGRQWSRRLLWCAVALVAALAALLLGGVGVMLWALLPALGSDPGLRVWALWLVPAGPALLAGFAATMGRAPSGAQALAETRAQWRTDVGLLRTVLKRQHA